MLNFASFRLFADSPAAYSARAIAIVERSLVIDMLAVLKIDFKPEAYANPLTEAEIAQFKTCGITGFHNSVGTGRPAGRRGDADLPRRVAGILRAATPTSSASSTRPPTSTAPRPQASARVIMGVQNSEHFQKAEDVKAFYQLGQRCSQLTYNSQNLIGTGGTDRVDGGVSDFGAEIIEAMNEAGMLVDVSHCGDRTTLDAIELSKKPIAITHSNCRALNNHPRLKTDEAITKLAAKGGVMGITGVRNFVRDREPTTIEHIVDHIDHVVKLVGIEHVGIGSDSDLNGYDDMPADQRKELMASYKSSYAFRDKLDTDGFDHPKKVFDLTEALIRRGYGDSNIESVLGGNFRRLLGTTLGLSANRPPRGNMHMGTQSARAILTIPAAIAMILAAAAASAQQAAPAEKAVLGEVVVTAQKRTAGARRHPDVGLGPRRAKRSSGSRPTTSRTSWPWSPASASTRARPASRASRCAASTPAASPRPSASTSTTCPSARAAASRMPRSCRATSTPSTSRGSRCCAARRARSTARARSAA